MVNLVQDMINKILWDRRIVLVPDTLSCPTKEIVIYNPTLDDRNIAQAAKESLLTYAKQNADIPSAEEIMLNAKNSGYWTEEDEKIFIEGDKYIAFLESERSKKKLIIQKQRIDEQIKRAKEQIAGTANRRQELLSLTADYMADEMYMLIMIARTVKTKDGKNLFVDENELLLMRQSNQNLLSFLLKEIISEGFLSHKEIRKVARSVDWRMLWTLNRENLGGLFNTRIGDLSINQRLLIYWSRVYDVAYESTERPDDAVINDDDQFDAWMQSRNDEKNDKQKTPSSDAHELGVVLDGYYIETCTCGTSKIKALGHGERTPHAIDCHWGKYVKYTRAEKEEKARQIYGRNNTKIRHLINAEQNAVEKMGSVDEKDLRGQKSRMILGSRQHVEQIRI